MKISESSTLGLHVRQIYREYLEMPGLRLTAAQAQRLWGIDAATCRQAFDVLIEARFIRYTDDDLYVRLTGSSTPLWMAKSTLTDKINQRDVAV